MAYINLAADPRFQGLDADHREWLLGKLGETPAHSDILDLAADESLDDDGRNAIGALMGSNSDRVRFAGTQVLGYEKSEAGETEVYEEISTDRFETVRRSALVSPKGEKERVTNVRNDMMPVLTWTSEPAGRLRVRGGAPEIADAICTAADRFVAPTRETMMIGALTGTAGMGQKETLAAMADALLDYPEKSTSVIEVNLREESDYRVLFGDDGPLGRLARMSYVPGYKQPKNEDGDPIGPAPRPAILLVTGTEVLGDSSIDGYDELRASFVNMLNEQRYLPQEPGEPRKLDPNFSDVPIFFEFEQPLDKDEPVEALESFGRLLGRDVSRNFKSDREARFPDLTGEEIYNIWGVPKINSNLLLRELNHLRIRVDKYSQDVFYDALETRHYPLKELPRRLEAFVFEEFDTKTDLEDTAGEVMGVFLARDGDDEDTRDGILEHLKSDNPDLELGAQMFHVMRAEVEGFDAGEQLEAIELAKELRDILVVQGPMVLMLAQEPDEDTGTTISDPRERALVQALGEGMMRLAGALSKVLDYAGYRRRRDYDTLLDHTREDALEESIHQLGAVLDTVEGNAPNFKGTSDVREWLETAERALLALSKNYLPDSTVQRTADADAVDDDNVEDT